MTHVLLPGDHSLELCQTKQQDNVVVDVVDVPSPEYFGRGDRGR
jgi:hypothetical protein